MVCSPQVFVKHISIHCYITKLQGLNFKCPFKIKLLVQDHVQWDQSVQ